MRDSYIADEKIGTMVRDIENREIGSFDPNAFHGRIVAVAESSGVPVRNLLYRLRKQVGRSVSVDTVFKQQFTTWLDSNYGLTQTTRR